MKQNAFKKLNDTKTDSRQTDDKWQASNLFDLIRPSRSTQNRNTGQQKRKRNQPPG